VLDFPAFIHECFRVYSWYSNGHFPDEGSWLDQSAAFVTLVETIDRAIAEAKDTKDKLDKARASAANPRVVRG